MPAYKDEKRKTWYALFYYEEWTGKKKRKIKRGFKRQKDALDFERDFLSKNAGTCDMTLKNLVEIYLKDMNARLRQSTLAIKKNIIDTKILPYFANKPINAIKAADIRQWQNEIMEDEEYRPTYLKTINNQFSAIMNYAVRYYDLPSNPCQKAGSMGSKKAENIDFWTLDEFRAFIPSIADKPRAQVGIEVMYWAGLRVGELLALMPRDYLKDRMALNIEKSWQIVEGEELIGPPKTPSGKRIVPIPPFLGERIEYYMGLLYECPEDERIFYGASKSFFAREIERGSKATGVKKIRVHDIRHSHVSLLINLGYDYMMIAERIGHEDIKYVMETYGHLYPNKHTELITKLEEMRLF